MKDMDKVFDQMTMVFKEMDKTFKTMEEVIDKSFTEAMTKQKYVWKKWFAWRPVTIKGKRVWMKTVYRKEIPKTYVTMDDWTRYEYGDMFDVIKDI